MKKIGLLLGGLVAGLWLNGAPGWAAADAPVLIRGVDVYPVTGPAIKSVSLLVENGRIADIGAKVAAPKGARIVEGKGLRVYPGMIDSATQLVPLWLNSAVCGQDIFRHSVVGQCLRALGWSPKLTPTFRCSPCLVPATPG